jgi:hypothetical protein
MRRPRLLLLLGTVALALWALAWWRSIDPPLSGNELRLVGTWTWPTKTGHTVLWLRPDRGSDYYYSNPDGTPASAEAPGRWCYRNGVLVNDHEFNVGRRLVRPVGYALGFNVSMPAKLQVEKLADDEVVVIYWNGQRETWTRADRK